MTTATQPKQEPRGEIAPAQPNEAQRPIWETVAELGSQIPDEEWKKVPEDSSLNYKQHLYGAPAKSG